MSNPRERAADELEYTRARKLVEEAVQRHICSWAETIELSDTEARFAKFREEVTEALHACMRSHIAGQYRRYERFSKLRNDFVALAKAATKAGNDLRGVEAILKRLPPMQYDPPFSLMHDPRATAFELDGLANAARRHADECKLADPGGQPRMRAFEALAEGLVSAYQRGARRTGVGRSAREGKLLDLAEAVLPTACELAKAVTGKPLQVSKDLGDYLHKIARRGRGS